MTTRGTDDLTDFNKTWAPHSGSPKVFPKQLAVVINSELERALLFAVHLDACIRYEDLGEQDHCDCGLGELMEYARRLAPFRYDEEGKLLPKYEPIAHGNPPLD